MLLFAHHPICCCLPLWLLCFAENLHFSSRTSRCPKCKVSRVSRSSRRARYSARSPSCGLRRSRTNKVSKCHTSDGIRCERRECRHGENLYVCIYMYVIKTYSTCMIAVICFSAWRSLVKDPRGWLRHRYAERSQYHQRAGGGLLQGASVCIAVVRR